MKKTLIKLVVLSTLGSVSTQVSAAGSLCTLPAALAGSAYINAYNDGRVIPPPAGPATTSCMARGNFGVTAIDSTSGCVVSTCAITGLPSEVSAPKTGYTIITSATRTIPTTTGGPGNIGSVLDAVWRKPAATAPVTPTPMCIIGTRVNMINADHDSGLAGTQYFEVNDIARGGYSGVGDAGVGYFKLSTAQLPMFRTGRTFTSVQHRAYKWDGAVAEKQSNGIGYLDLPTIGGSSTLAINGVAGGIGGNTVATTGGNATLQHAQVNSNWVDFTIDAYFLKNLSTQSSSPMTYIEFPCNSDTAAVINSTWVKAGAIRVRQTGQQLQSSKEIAISGFAPPGAVVP